MRIVSITTTGSRVGQHLQWRVQRLVEADLARQVAASRTKEIYEAVKELTSLTDHSLADLRRMGHPYAQRVNRPPHPPERTHIQSGNYNRGWRRYVLPSRLRGEAGVYNNVRYAGFLDMVNGTHSMIRRGPLAAAEKQVAQRHHDSDELGAAFAKTVKL